MNRFCQDEQTKKRNVNRFELPLFENRNRNLTQHIIHTLVKATVFESVCHFRTQVSAIATHFLQTVFSTVHYMILLCQIPVAFLVIGKSGNSNVFEMADEKKM